MDQYETENAAFKIDGYFLARPNEDARAAFERAKAETVKNLEKGIANVESLTFEQFQAYKK